MLSSGLRAERAISDDNTTTATTNAPMVRPSFHPHSSLWTNPRASALTPTTIIDAPRKSGGNAGWRWSARRSIFAPTTTTAAPSGTLMKKIQRQPPAPTIAAPSEGPVAPPSPPVAPHKPMAMLRRPAGKKREINDSELGVCMALPTACTMRAPMSTRTLGASPESSEPRANRPTPNRNTRPLPMRSASRPLGTSIAAAVIVYTVITHESSARLTSENESRMSLNATTTTVMSSVETNDAAHTNASTRQAAPMSPSRTALCPQCEPKKSISALAMTRGCSASIA